MMISNDVVYIGVNDHKIDLFEGQYDVPNGMAYNSYVIIDEKVAVFDTVDESFTSEWLANLKAALGERKPDYLIVQHMEPDHSAGIAAFVSEYPEAEIVASEKTFSMIPRFFDIDV
ncbi:MAG: MBL fold metallo-hydrolase, partial [Acutalibacteraceae bacterium]